MANGSPVIATLPASLSDSILGTESATQIFVPFRLDLGGYTLYTETLKKANTCVPTPGESLGRRWVGHAQEASPLYPHSLRIKIQRQISSKHVSPHTCSPAPKKLV